jgi:hypothetical protein
MMENGPGHQRHETVFGYLVNSNTGLWGNNARIKTGFPFYSFSGIADY